MNVDGLMTIPSVFGPTETMDRLAAVAALGGVLTALAAAG